MSVLPMCACVFDNVLMFNSVMLIDAFNYFWILENVIYRFVTKSLHPRLLLYSGAETTSLLR